MQENLTLFLPIIGIVEKKRDNAVEYELRQRSYIQKSILPAHR